MNTEHRYIFEKNKKHLCPVCNKKRFVRYVDTNTGNYLPNIYGRCDRESKCSYFLNPYKDGYTKMIWEQEQGNKTEWKPKPKKKRIKPLKVQKTAFIPVEVLSLTLEGYEKNVFIQNLLSRVKFPFEINDIEKIISLYNLGTVQNGYRTGANTFPFIDKNNNVRTIQVKQFDEANHTTGTDFLHSIIEKHHSRNSKQLPEWLKAYNENEIKVSCLFGEHLLTKYPHNPIALVEAPKTAIYGTLYFGFPQQPKNLLWLAVYNLSSLNLNKCMALKGRNVFLFPDLSKDGKAFELWSKKANEIQKQLQGTSFTVSDLLEQLAPEQDKQKGKDIADYLIKQDWKLYRKQEVKALPMPEPVFVEIPKSEKSEKSEALKTTLFLEPKQLPKVEVLEAEPLINWDSEIKELEDFFKSIKLPDEPIKLNSSATIKNNKDFITNHLATVKANNGRKTFEPYLNRLKSLKYKLQNQ